MADYGYTLKEKLEQLRDTKVGGCAPPFMDPFNYVVDLQRLAIEALAEIEKLEEKAWKYDDLCK